MTRIISLIILAGGLALLVMAVQASQSLSSDFSRLFTNAPTDKSIWLMAGGAVVCAIGIAGLSKRFQ